MSERLPAVPRTDVPVQQQQQVAAPTSPESGNGGGMLRGLRGEPPLGTAVHTFPRHQGVGFQTERSGRNAASVLQNYDEYQAQMQLELFSLLGARGEAALLLAAGTTTKQGIPILNPDPLARLIG